MLYLGHKNGKILWAGGLEYSSDTSEVIAVPKDLETINKHVLVTEYIVWRNKIIRQSELWDMPIEELRVAVISLYSINCGIATYTKYLCDAMRPLVKELKIFAEDAEPEFCINDAQDNVVRCWDRRDDYMRIFPEIESYNPDLIIVQHEYGSFSRGASWNALLGNLSRWRTLVMLHSVYDHPDKLIFEAPCQEIITHSLGGKKLLKAKGIDHCPIHYVPHGCLSELGRINTKFSNVGSDHLLFQYGFGFEYKGWDNAILIVDKLKEKYPDVMYVGIFNTSKYAKKFHDHYYDLLIEKIRQRNLQKHFTLLKGFRSEEVLLSYLSQSKVGLFPYWNHHEWRVYGGSGAVRLAMASGIPLVLGDVPFFEEFRGYIPICQHVDEYVDTISRIFEDKPYEESIKQNIAKFISERTWDKVARWYLECKPDKEFVAPVGNHEN